MVPAQNWLMPSNRWEKNSIAGTLDSSRIGLFLYPTAPLYTVDIPDPDFIIRTSGEYRLSNFLLLQSAYAEIYFTPTLWPDFKEADFEAALADFSQRERRFGSRQDALDWISSQTNVKTTLKPHSDDFNETQTCKKRILSFAILWIGLALLLTLFGVHAGVFLITALAFLTQLELYRLFEKWNCVLRRHWDSFAALCFVWALTTAGDRNQAAISS